MSWERAHDGGCLRIADSGLGMTSDKLERLFEPFNRLGAEKSKIEGTGIGLVLSRRLVELMHGELQIASTLGRGTVATLLLKPAEAPSSRPGAPAPPSQHGDFDGTLRVLYAEDDEVNVELIRQVVLLRPAVALSVATSGASALEMARRDPPDLMLVDMNLGDMTGLELARALAAQPGHRRPSPGRALGRCLARADPHRAGRRLRELPHQAGRLPQAPQRARRRPQRRGRSGSASARRRGIQPHRRPLLPSPSHWRRA